jgi:hypothetical protein
MCPSLLLTKLSVAENTLTGLDFPLVLCYLEGENSPWQPPENPTDTNDGSILIAFILFRRMKVNDTESIQVYKHITKILLVSGKKNSFDSLLSKAAVMLF